MFCTGSPHYLANQWCTPFLSETFCPINQKITFAFLAFASFGYNQHLPHVPENGTQIPAEHFAWTQCHSTAAILHRYLIVVSSVPWTCSSTISQISSLHCAKKHESWKRKILQQNPNYWVQWAWLVQGEKLQDLNYIQIFIYVYQFYKSTNSTKLLW